MVGSHCLNLHTSNYCCSLYAILINHKDLSSCLELREVASFTSWNSRMNRALQMSIRSNAGKLITNDRNMKITYNTQKVIAFHSERSAGYVI